MINRICSLALCCLVVQSVCAQTVRNISVSQQSAYTDHVSLEDGAVDKDVMVKFVFNEAENTLTVNLISYRSLFVFQDQVRYKPLIKGRTIRPDKLPYVVTFDPTEKYRISTLFKSSLPQPRKRFVFSRWISYEGLQIVPQEYKMVNDYISQTFDILNKRSEVKLTLRDVFLIDDVSKVPNKKRYEIPFGRDLYREYRITIERNPCFGLEEDSTAAANALQSVRKGYAAIKEKYGSGTVGSKSSLDVFQEMKGLLQKQYPHKDVQSPCPAIQDTWDQYNQCVDSIASMQCVVAGQGAGGPGGEGVSAKTLLNAARQIDDAVSRWLLSGDAVERRDIILQCESTIKSTNDAISELGVRTAEQQKALTVFREAVRYYQGKCR